MMKNRMFTACSLIAALNLSSHAANSYKSMLHMGSSIMSTSRGYGTSFYATLSPLSLTNIDYANLETISAISQSLSKTKTTAIALTSDKTSMSTFGGASEKVPKDNTPLYAGYDIVNFTLDYHSVKGWREGAATDASKKASVQKQLESIFDRFHKDYPNAICTFTNSTPVKEPFWGDAKDNYDFAYNSVVKAISKWAGESAKAKNVPFIDLYGYCEQNGIKPGGDGRHFSATDRDKQGKFVGQQMLIALGKATSTSSTTAARIQISRDAPMKRVDFNGILGAAMPEAVLLNGKSVRSNIGRPVPSRLLIIH